MATKTIKGFHDGTIVVKSSKNIYNIDENAVVMSGKVDPASVDPVGAIMERLSKTPLPSHNKFNIDGEVIGYQIGILTGGAHDAITVGKTGLIESTIGIYSTGKATHIENRGHIISAADSSGPTPAIGALGPQSHVQNDGLIEAIVGITAQGAGEVVVNGKHGIIRAVGIGVEIDSMTGAASKFTNHGLVQITATGTGLGAYQGGGGDDAVVNDGTITGSLSLGDGKDTLTNSGTITGPIIGGADDDMIVNTGRMTGGVDLGDGNDTFDNRGGKVTGSIVGGLGDDTLITDNAKIVLNEDAAGGTDTVRSTVSYKLTDNVEKLVLIGKADINGTGLDAADDTLVGNAGNNTLRGLGGMDDLSGGKGNDMLWGGGDADTFHFSKGDGHDTIADFVEATDKVDLSQWTGMTDLGAVTGHAEDQGNDVLITLGQDSLLIRNIHEAQLTDADFVYSAA